MFQALKSILSSIGGETPHDRFDANDYRLVSAALLVHAARIDGEMSDAERDRLRAVMQQRFALDDAATDELIIEAVATEVDAIDLYRFTASLNRSLDAIGRARVIEMMWQVIFADGKVTEFEDNLVWRAADLLGVSREERIALRNRAGLER